MKFLNENSMSRVLINKLVESDEKDRKIQELRHLLSLTNPNEDEYYEILDQLEALGDYTYSQGENFADREFEDNQENDLEESNKAVKEDAWDDNFVISVIQSDGVYWKRKSDGKEIKTSFDVFKEPTDPTEWKSEEELNQYTLTEASGLPNISKFVYDLDKDKGDAWSVNSYTEDNKGNKIIIVTKNGKSENTDKDIINAVEKKYPQLKGYETENHKGVWFYLNDINLKESIDTSEYTHKDSKFKYMLLDRLKQDCEYFLGNGNGAEKHLWAGNIDDQIKLMKDLYNSFSDNQKPEWISIEDIDNYEKQMKSYNKKQVNTAKNSATNLNEDSYESGIFYEIEEALREAGLNPTRFNEDGIMTNNIGWTVTGEDGTEQQITCDGSYLDDEENNQ